MSGPPGSSGGVWDVNTVREDLELDADTIMDFVITDWDVANDEIKISGHHKFAFDPFDGIRGKWRIRDGDQDYDDLEIEFGSGPEWTWPVEDDNPDRTTIKFKNNPFTLFPPDNKGNFQRPNKTIGDFLDWWGDEDTAGAGLLRALVDVLAEN